jgi:hypothetical protein
MLKNILRGIYEILITVLTHCSTSLSKYLALNPMAIFLMYYKASGCSIVVEHSTTNPTDQTSPMFTSKAGAYTSVENLKVASL